MNRKGQIFSTLNNALVGFVVLVILAIVVFQITTDARADLVADSTAYNATLDLEDAQENITEKTPLLATIIIFGVILTAAFVLFARRTS